MRGTSIALSRSKISPAAKTKFRCPHRQNGPAVEIRHGTYRHYKNHLYLVIGCATHTETDEELVIYRALYGERRLFARPKAMFLETVTIEGRQVARFEYVENPKMRMLP